MTPLRAAVLCDFTEENWPSMDLIAEMLLLHLAKVPIVAAHRIQPCFSLRAGRLNPTATAKNADRLINRFWDYPRSLHVHRNFDIYHLIDHSYAHLLHRLPANRTVVTCHDTDTFRCLFQPCRERRPVWFRAMSRHILNGLRKAAFIACPTHATRQALLEKQILSPDRIVVVPNGIDSSCTPLPCLISDNAADRLLGPRSSFELLHVGSTIPRKRIEDLLHTLAEVRRHEPRIRLIRVGGAFTPQQSALVRALDLERSIKILPFLSRPILAAVYRRAHLCLLPSDAEGFGLPVAESLACGTLALASGIPALREVGGDSASYCSVGCIQDWSGAVLKNLMMQPEDKSQLIRRGIAHASQFNWDHHASSISALYMRTLGEWQRKP